MQLLKILNIFGFQRIKNLPIQLAETQVPNLAMFNQNNKKKNKVFQHDPRGCILFYKVVKYFVFCVQTEVNLFTLLKVFVYICQVKNSQTSFHEMHLRTVKQLHMKIVS